MNPVAHTQAQSADLVPRNDVNPVVRQRKPLRVVGPKNYTATFNINVGQRNAVITLKPLDRHRKYFPSYDPSAFTFTWGRGLDLLHTFNAVPVLSRKPFVVTFESDLPRIWDHPGHQRMRRWLWRRLSSRRCLAIIAISQSTLNEWRHAYRNFPGFAHLMSKTRLLYPSVPLRRSSPKTLDGKLKMCFVGRDFMRKGMPVVLRAHRQLRKLGVDVETTVVSSLNWSPQDYIGPRAGYDIDAEKALLSQPGVRHVRSMPNDQVIRLFDECHFSSCPTMHDTFGYSVLESMSCATPVIASDTCAMPEMIAHDECGYLLPMENDDQVGRWIWTFRKQDPQYNDAFRAAVDRMADAMAKCLLKCVETPSEYEQLSAGAIERVRSRFEVSILRRQLELIYEKARNPWRRP